MINSSLRRVLLLVSTILSATLLVSIHPTEAFILPSSNTRLTRTCRSSINTYVYTFSSKTLTLHQRLYRLYASGLDNDDDNDSNSSSSPIDAFVDDVKLRFRIFQESNASGSSLKQTVANVIAGEYDEAAVRDEVEELIQSAPCGKWKE